MRRREYLLFLFVLFSYGCASYGKGYSFKAITYYNRAISVVDAVNTPEDRDIEQAFEFLDTSIKIAKEELEEHSSLYRPCEHDQLAYIIPLARIAKAKLYSRLNQIRNQEEEGWKAIYEAENYIGRHVRENNTRDYMFGTYAVFFRREKIRRYVFTILKETYRRSGERDLEQLMASQIGMSSIYLQSSVAHNEEKYIRAIENSDWVRINALKEEDLKYSIFMFFAYVLAAIQEVAHAAEQQMLEEEYYNAENEYQRQRIEARMRRAERRANRNRQRLREMRKNLRKQHRREIHSIQRNYRNFVSRSLIENFSMLRFSDEIKNLDAYWILMRKKEDLDNYLKRNGFGSQAAKKLMGIRTALDQLTRELQRRRGGR